MTGVLRFIPMLLGVLFLAGSAQAADDLEVRALLVPAQEAVLSSRIDGCIVRLPVEEGDRFQRNQDLVEFDCTILKAELDKARMDLEAAVETHEAQLRLQKFGSTSELEVAVASAKRKRAAAEVLLMETKVGMCVIVAPFSGRVIKRRAHPFENVRPDDPILEILDDTQLKLHLLVPSRWLRWLQAGQGFVVRVDETGRKYTATVTGLGARVNPVNQTLEVEAAIAGSHAELLAGMSGTAFFAPPPGEGSR